MFGKCEKCRCLHSGQTQIESLQQLHHRYTIYWLCLTLFPARCQRNHCGGGCDNFQGISDTDQTSNANHLGKVAKETYLRRKPKKETRLSSTYQMLLRRVKLRNHVMNLDEREADELLLSVASKQKVDNLLRNHWELDNVPKKLHRTVAAIPNVRVYFDIVLKDYLKLSNRLSSDAWGVKDQCLDSGLLIVQKI